MMAISQTDIKIAVVTGLIFAAASLIASKTANAIAKRR
jgi:hypothetical protein